MRSLIGACVPLYVLQMFHVRLRPRHHPSFIENFALVENAFSVGRFVVSASQLCNCSDAFLLLLERTGD